MAVDPRRLAAGGIFIKSGSARGPLGGLVGDLNIDLTPCNN